MKALAGTSAPEVILDFSVAREENGISGKLAIIRECMDQGKKLSFLYTNAEDREKQFEVEPAACIFNGTPGIWRHIIRKRKATVCLSW